MKKTVFAIMLLTAVFTVCAACFGAELPDNCYRDSQGVVYTLDSVSKKAVVGGGEAIYNTSLYDGTSGGAVTIPSTLTVQGVTYPVTEIESFAFAYSDKLTKSTIPSSVRKVGYSVFAGCKNLTAINVSAGNMYFKSVDGNLYSKSGKTLYAFADGNNKSSFSLPDTATIVAAGAFEGTVNLKQLNLNKATTIGEFAFSNSSVKSVVLNVTALSDGVFANSSVECAVLMSDKLTKIGKAAFYGCSKLKTLILPETVSVDDDAFGACTLLEKLIFCSASEEALSADALKGLPSGCKVIYRAGKTAFDSYSGSAALTSFSYGEKKGGAVTGMLAACQSFAYRTGSSGTQIEFAAHNMTDAAKTVTAYVTFYSDDNRLVDVSVLAETIIDPYGAAAFTASTACDYSSYSIFLLDGNLAPLGVELA